jgi:hypothetical protein
MPSTLLDFVSGALRGSIECSLADLRSLREYATMGPLEVLGELASTCDRLGIECTPALTSGELDDRRVFSGRKAPDEFASGLAASRQSGEGHRVEFKQTLGLNVRRLENDPAASVAELFQEEIIHEVIKTVVAFLNADGGVLVIGLRDDGTPYGIEQEFAYLGGSRNQDQWELKLNAAFDAFIPDFRIILGYVRYAIVECEGCQLCVVMVEPRRDNISVCRRPNRDGADEILYRRSGNQSLRLQARDIEALVMARVRAAEGQR